MQRLVEFLGRFARDAGGATSIEYGLIAVLIAVGALMGMTSLGTGLAGSWNDTAQKASEAMK